MKAHMLPVCEVVHCFMFLFLCEISSFLSSNTPGTLVPS